MRDPTGAVAGRIFAFRDISAERVVEQMKSEFVTNVSRELRSPLTSIYGFAETVAARRRPLRRGRASDVPRLHRFGVRTPEDRSSTGCSRWRGSTPATCRCTSPSPTSASLIRGVVRSAQHTEPADGHTFVLDLPAEPLAAEADPEKLRQIVTDLVENAVKYSPRRRHGHGGSARRGNDGVEVSVDDEGIGVPESGAERSSSGSSTGPTPTAASSRARAQASASLSRRNGSRRCMGGSGCSRVRSEGSSFGFGCCPLRGGGKRVR